MKKEKAKCIIHNTLLAVLYSVVPFLGLLSIYPVLVAGLNYNITEAVIVAVTSFILYYIIPAKLHFVPADAYLIIMITAVFMLINLRRKMNGYNVLVITCITALTGIMLLYGNYIFDTDGFLTKRTEESFNNNKEIVEQWLTHNNKSMNGMTFNDFKKLTLSSVDLLPGIISGMIVIFIIINYYIVQNSSKKNRLKIKFNFIEPFVRFKVNDWFIWGIIFGLTLMVVRGFYIIDKNFYKMGLNCFIFCSILFAFQGMAIAKFYFDKWKIPLFLFILTIFLLFQFVPVFALIGIGDVWFDIRRLNKKPGIPNNEGIQQ